MNKTLRRFLIGAGIFAAVGLLAVLVVFIAISGNNEDAVKEDAEAYTENRFQSETDVYGVLYDSMGNQPFKAAAQVRHVDDGIEFLVYRNEDNQLGRYVRILQMGRRSHRDGDGIPGRAVVRGRKPRYPFREIHEQSAPLHP